MSSTRDALCMCDLCRKRAAAYSRTETFAAIQRALEVARKYDRIAKESEYHAYLLWREYQEDAKDDRDYARLCYERAEAIRIAIRAAIGSDKA